MNLALKRSFENQIMLLRGFDFENFVRDLLLLRYTAAGFTPTREKKDLGCDGIITSSSTIVACFGPEAYDESQFNKKAGDDYKQYKTNWQANYPNWQFVYNGKLAPKAIQRIRGLHIGAVPWGVDNLMAIIENELNRTQQRKVGELLGIPKQQISHDYLLEVLENLLVQSRTDPTIVMQYKKDDLVEVGKKIEINYDAADVELAIDEYSNLIVDIYETGNIFKSFNDEEQSRIKSKIIGDFKNANGSFKERLKIVSDNYLQQYSSLSDDDYRHNITSVLLYLFEECSIGSKIK